MFKQAFSRRFKRCTQNYSSCYLGTNKFLVQDIDFTISGLNSVLPVEPLSNRITDVTGPVWERETTCEFENSRRLLQRHDNDLYSWYIAAISEGTSADENDVVTLKIKGVTQNMASTIMP